MNGKQSKTSEFISLLFHGDPEVHNTNKSFRLNMIQ